MALGIFVFLPAAPRPAGLVAKLQRFDAALFSRLKNPALFQRAGAKLFEAPKTRKTKASTPYL